jgi:hypothetical protein
MNTWYVTPIIAFPLQIFYVRAYKASQREESCADRTSVDAVSKRPPYPHRDYGEKLRLTTKTAVHSLVELSPLDPLYYSRNEITTGYIKGDLLNEKCA